MGWFDYLLLGILLFSTLVGVLRGFVREVFSLLLWAIGLLIASVGIIMTWATIVLCQIQLKRWADKGWVERPTFRMFGAPYTGYLSLLFLIGVLAMVFID